MTQEHGSLRVSESESAANLAEIVPVARQKFLTSVIGPIPVGDTEQDLRILQLCPIYEKTAAELKVPYLPVANELMTNAVWKQKLQPTTAATPAPEGTHCSQLKFYSGPRGGFESIHCS